MVLVAKYAGEKSKRWIFSDIQTKIKSKPFADDAGNAINSIEQGLDLFWCMIPFNKKGGHTMDLQNLKEHHEELLSFMENKWLFQYYIRRFREEINRKLAKAGSHGWHLPDAYLIT